MWTTSSTVSRLALMAGWRFRIHAPIRPIGLLVAFLLLSHPVLPGHVHAGRNFSFRSELGPPSLRILLAVGNWHFYIAHNLTTVPAVDVAASSACRHVRHADLLYRAQYPSPLLRGRIR